MIFPITIVIWGGKILRNNIFTHKIQRSLDDELIIKTIIEPDIVVLSGINELDRLLGGFRAGELTFIDGDADIISAIPNQICVNTYRTFDSDTIYIDGGICADPYEIARYARFMEIDQKETLQHVHISRAFTVYQMTTLIQDMLESVIKRYKPQTLLIGRYPFLYLDSDIKSKEAQTLLRVNLEKIRRLTNEYKLITIFTNLDKKLVSSRRNIRHIMYKNVDEIISMKQRDQCIHVELVNRDKDTMILTFADGQLRLQDFGMVV